MTTRPYFYSTIKFNAYGLYTNYENQEIPKKDALLMSVLKWAVVATEIANKNYRHSDDGAGETCALCWVYQHKDCYHCPIDIAGYSGCVGTPYQWFKKAVSNNDPAQAEYQALNEYAFLISLVDDIREIELFIETLCPGEKFAMAKAASMVRHRNSILGQEIT